MAHQSFTLRFIEDVNKSKKDVVIKVSPLDKGFTWTFQDKRSSVYYVNLGVTASYERMDSILTMIQYDKFPPSDVQIDIPGYPQLFMSFSNFLVMKPRILESFLTTMRGWPKRLKLCRCEHEEEGESWEVDDNADNLSAVSNANSMPPLMPLSQENDYC